MPFSGHSFNHPIMIKHYLLIAIRHLFWNKLYTGINLIGLSIGMACFILIAMFVWDEKSYDAFHEKANRIYRISPPDYARTAPRLASSLEGFIPEIEHAIQLKGGSGVMKYQDKQFFEEEYMFVKPEIFKVFSFEFKQGTPENALSEPNSMVINERLALKYFGQTDVLGETLTYQDSIPLTVTGVVADWPEQSHLYNDAWISFETYLNLYDPNMETWSNNIYYTYVLLEENVEPAVFDEKLQAFTATTINTLPNREDYSLAAQHLREIHLQSDKAMELEVNGSLSQIYIFSSIAFFILLIAGINYVNLSTARANRHAKEIGVRKTMGAGFRQLISQFMSESVVLSLLALLLALGIVMLSLPAFNRLAEKSFDWTWIFNMPVLASLMGVAVLIGLLAGAYPALVLSSFRPIEVLKGKLRQVGRQKVIFRHSLVIFQFAISLILLVGTLVVFQQIKYLKDQPLGFAKDQILVVPFYWDAEVVNQFDLIKREWESHPQIEKVTASGDIPGRMATQMGYWVEGMEQDEWEGIDALYVHDDFVQTYGMEMIAGRAFNKEIQSDAETGFILNESAVRSIGWTPEEAIGKRFDVHKTGSVLGVVKDFHFNSLHQQIRPLVIGVRPDWCGYLSLKTSVSDLQTTINGMEKSWQQVFPSRPFEYLFLDEDFERHYLAETKLSKVASVFAFLAVLIACIGLFGLATYTCTQRRKEIAVRKVLGASLRDIMTLLSASFIRPVLLAFVLAIPLGYFLMNQWLNGFAYQTSISAWWFVICCIALMVIAAFSISLQAMRAALDNPVKALKSE